MDDKALLALQGPDARQVLARFASNIDSLSSERWALQARRYRLLRYLFGLHRRGRV